MSKTGKFQVLYIEDDIETAELCRAVLGNYDYTVELAYTGKEGLELFQSSEYDAVILDYRLPDVDGLEVAEEILKQAPDISIIFMTARGSEQVAAEAMTLGVAYYVVKDNPNVYSKLLPEIVKKAITRTEEKREIENVQEKLRTSEEIYRSIFENSAEGIISIDSIGVIESFNPHAEAIFGYTAQEVIGENVAILVAEDVRAQHIEYTSQSELNAPRIINHARDLIGQRKNGTNFPMELNVSPMTTNGKQKYIGIMRDITERKEVESTLVQSENRFRDFAESAADRFWETDKNHKYTYMSPPAGAMKRPVEDLIGELPWSVASRRHSSEHDQAIQAAFEAQKPFRNIRNIGTAADGGRRHLALNGVPYYDANGNFAGFRGSTTDETEEIEARLLIEEQEHRFKDLAEAGADRFWETDIDHRFTFFSSPSGNLSYPVEKLIGKRPWEFPERIPAIHWDELTGNFDAHIQFKDFRYTSVSETGSTVHVRMSGTPVFETSGKFKGFRGVVCDETEEVEARKMASATEQQFADAINHLNAGFSLWDSNDILLIANDHIRLIYPEIAHLLVAGNSFTHVMRHLAESGGLDLRGESVDEWIGLAAGYHRQKDENYDIHLNDGRWIQIRKQRLEDGSTLAFHFDITKDKQAQEEVELARQSAENANRAKSDFLSSMSHELRTPMNAILGFGQLLEHNPAHPLSDQQSDHVQQILKGGEHLLNLIDQVLELSKIEAGKIGLSVETVELEPLVQECVAMLVGRASNANIEIANETPDHPLPKLKSDRIRLQQILLNLLSNAVKYNRDGGKVTFSYEHLNDDRLRIMLKDTGHGIPADKQVDLFEPFCRLGREAGEIEGSGIGLTITKQLVELLGGFIDFESTEDEGSKFWIDIPIAKDQLARAGKINSNDISEDEFGKSDDRLRKVLYVEDNPANVHLMEAVIERLPNLELISAHTAELGLDMANDQQPDLIVMDINLPGMDGIEAVKILQTNAKTKLIPVIALTAAAMPQEIARGKNVGFKDYVTKPFQVPELLKSIRENLR